LALDPRSGFKNVGGDLSVRDIATTSAVCQMAAAQVVHEYNEKSGRLQLACTLVVVIDTVAGDEPGTSGNEQHGGA